MIALVLVHVRQPVTGVVKRMLAVHADPARLRSHVETLAHMAPRSAARRENLVRASDYIRDQLVAAGAEVSFQAVEDDGSTFRNVIARLGPESKELIVVGAHYDAAEAAVGADDNASGVAGLLELARLAQAEPLPMRLELVAYCSEEPPSFRTQAMGSFVHADGLRREGAIVRAMICLEMIGYFSDAPGSQHFPFPGMQLLYPSSANFIAVVGCLGQESLVREVKRGMAEVSELPVDSMNAPRFVAGIDFSDHLNYWDAGFPAVMVTDTAFYRNPNYHEASDTPQTLDFSRMRDAVDGVFGALQRLSR
ncbi:MAG TPA: M28 family peptidase [Planctomycetota bacterium]|nr:M28 family peptidase [Planctomycetota bacterium]